MRRLLAAILAASVFAGCAADDGGEATNDTDDDTTPTPTPTGGDGVATIEVSVVDFGFEPEEVTVASGGTVLWTNTGAVAHTVTADDGSFDSGSLAPDGTFEDVFDTPGTYAYHCEFHPIMTGTLVVE